MNTPILAENKWWRLVVLCGLYVAQGVPFGFVTVTLAAAIAAAMGEEGASDIETTAAISSVVLLAGLPWSFKWIAGPFIDRFQVPGLGRRRPWILLAQAGMIVTLIQMAMLDDPTHQIHTLGWLAFVHNIFNAVQDVSVDALAVDLLPSEERGRISGLMYGSKYFGVAIGGAGLSFVAARTDLSSAMVAMIIVIGLISLLPLLTLERRGEHRLIPSRALSNGSTAGPRPGFVAIFGELRRAFSHRGALITGVVCVVAMAASGALSPIGTQLFVDELGWGQEKYGAVTGGAAIGAGLVGAIAGGFLADLIGARRLAAIATVGYGGLLMGFGFVENLWRIDAVSMPYLIVESFLQGCFVTSLFAICIGVSRPIVAATQFTAYMALLNVSTSWGTAASPSLHEGLGTSGAFVAAGAFQAAIALLLPLTLVRPLESRPNPG
jgi:PAT family beta-lactamase induction signal transducer AmpG